MQDLTPTQWRVLGLMLAFHADEDRLPTRLELAALGGWKSANNSEEHIAALVKKGVLERRRGGNLRFARTEQTTADLTDRVLELDIKAASLRIELARRMEAGDGCYFVANGDAAHWTAVRDRLIARRSPTQCERLARLGGAAA